MFWKLFNWIKVEQIESAQLREWLADSNGTKPIIIDVRTPQEWRQTGVIPGSIMMTPKQVEMELGRNLNLDNDRPKVVVCRSGIRSKRVAKHLIKNEIEEVYNLKGGIISWYNIRGEIEGV